MSIYKLKGDIKNYWTFFIDATEIAMKMGDNFDLDYDGISKLSWWKPVDGSFHQEDENKTKKVAIPDIDIWSSNLVLNEKAKEVLLPYIESLGELLPVNCEGISYNLFNTMNVIDDSAVDKENSQRIEEQGIFMGIESLQFFEDKVSEKSYLFRTSFDNYVDVYCNESFKEIVEKARLKGLCFEAELDKY